MIVTGMGVTITRIGALRSSELLSRRGLSLGVEVFYLGFSKDAFVLSAHLIRILNNG